MCVVISGETTANGKTSSDTRVLGEGSAEELAILSSIFAIAPIALSDSVRRIGTPPMAWEWASELLGGVACWSVSTPSQQLAELPDVDIDAALCAVEVRDTELPAMGALPPIVVVIVYTYARACLCPCLPPYACLSVSAGACWVRRR